ncbi:hypothetical protein HDU79_000811 [Rhizoclosmatium sp. JEL0117]|nr:hypothetical protein HDU79_000811 [Rhizoclosmatium sp. JEL0117]
MANRHSPPPPSSRNRATTTSAASARAKPKSLLKRRPVPKDEHRKFGFATTDVAFAMAGDELVLADGAELPHVSRTVLHNTAANVEITLRHDLPDPKKEPSNKHVKWIGDSPSPVQEVQPVRQYPRRGSSIIHNHPISPSVSEPPPPVPPIPKALLISPTVSPPIPPRRASSSTSAKKVTSNVTSPNDLVPTPSKKPSQSFNQQVTVIQNNSTVQTPVLPVAQPASTYSDWDSGWDDEEPDANYESDEDRKQTSSRNRKHLSHTSSIRNSRLVVKTPLPGLRVVKPTKLKEQLLQKLETQKQKVKKFVTPSKPSLDISAPIPVDPFTMKPLPVKVSQEFNDDSSEYSSIQAPSLLLPTATNAPRPPTTPKSPPKRPQRMTPIISEISVTEAPQQSHGIPSSPIRRLPSTSSTSSSMPQSAPSLPSTPATRLPLQRTPSHDLPPSTPLSRTPSSRSTKTSTPNSIPTFTLRDNLRHQSLLSLNSNSDAVADTEDAEDQWVPTSPDLKRGRMEQRFDGLDKEFAEFERDVRERKEVGGKAKGTWVGWMLGRKK